MMMAQSFILYKKLNSVKQTGSCMFSAWNENEAVYRSDLDP